jgi:hypothetical protein
MQTFGMSPCRQRVVWPVVVLSQIRVCACFDEENATFGGPRHGPPHFRGLFACWIVLDDVEPPEGAKLRTRELGIEHRQRQPPLIDACVPDVTDPHALDAAVCGQRAQKRREDLSTAVRAKVDVQVLELVLVCEGERTRWPRSARARRAAVMRLPLLSMCILVTM